MLAAIAVLHCWRALSPIGTRRLEVAVRHHAGAASETSTGRVKPAATRTVHPPSTTKPIPRTLDSRGCRILLPLQRTAAYPFANTCGVVRAAESDLASA
jgi:hypothetical protein